MARSTSQCDVLPNVILFDLCSHRYGYSALTDPLISGIAKGSQAYKLVGSFVSTPLNWCIPLLSSAGCLQISRRAVITGVKSKFQDISDLKGTTLGISRYGR